MDKPRFIASFTNGAQHTQNIDAWRIFTDISRSLRIRVKHIRSNICFVSRSEELVPLPLDNDATNNSTVNLTDLPLTAISFGSRRRFRSKKINKYEKASSPRHNSEPDGSHAKVHRRRRAIGVLHNATVRTIQVRPLDRPIRSK